jgi:hypothetical protein
LSALPPVVVSGLPRESGDRVDHDHVHRAGAHQHVGDLERLLPRVRLRNQQLVDVDPELGRVLGIERVFGVNERRRAAHLLRLGHHLQRERGLARGFRTVDLDHPAARQTAHAERQIQPERTGGDHLHVLDRLGVHAHHRALAELLFDLGQGRGQRLRLVLVHRVPLLVCAGICGGRSPGRHRVLYKRPCIVAVDAGVSTAAV